MSPPKGGTASAYTSVTALGASRKLSSVCQVAPNVLIACDGYFCNGKYFNCLDKVASLVPGVVSLNRLLNPFLSASSDQLR